MGDVRGVIEGLWGMFVRGCEGMWGMWGDARGYKGDWGAFNVVWYNGIGNI